MLITSFPLLGVITWIGMANSQPAQGYINDAITMIAVPAGLGILGAILYSFFWNIAIYLVGGKDLSIFPLVCHVLFTDLYFPGMGGLAFGLFVLCWREDLVITQVKFSFDKSSNIP